MANRNLSPDTSLSLLILRAISAGIRPSHIYCPHMWKRSFQVYQSVIEKYRSKGFTLLEIERIINADLSPMQVYYAINKDKAQKEEQKKREENAWNDVKTNLIEVNTF